MSADRHWVEDLFPPVFRINSDDTKSKSSADGRHPADTNVYKLAAMRISRYDPETIRNVYERVWLLDTIREQQEERRKQVEVDNVQKAAEEAAESRKKRQAADPSGTLIMDALSLTASSPPSFTRADDSQLWTSEELGVLREVFAAVQKENARTKAALAESERRAELLEKRCAEQAGGPAGDGDTLTEANRANARLQLLVENMKQEARALRDEKQQLRHDLDDLREQKAEVDKELGALRKTASVERIRKQELEIDLQDSHQAATRSLQLHEQQLVARFSQQVAALQRQVYALRAELEQERDVHSRTRRGLQHLQKHFSALPLQGEQSRRTMVTEDQLTDWSY